jgi:hypothetical protein
MAINLTDKIFFYCLPQGTPDKAAYQHGIVCLGEGLKSLKIEFNSNINYWKTSLEKEEYLFCQDSQVTPDDCSVVVLNDLWFRYGQPFPENLFHSSRKYITVYLELWKESNFALKPEFRKFDLVLKAQCNRSLKYPSNCHPWTFGLSNRILKETDTLPDFKERKQHLLVNFRVGHSVRQVVGEKFLPRIQSVLPIDNSSDSFDAPPASSYDYLQWSQTGRRHYPNYYKRLRESAACACFGGVLQPSWTKDPAAPTKLWHRILSKLDLRPTQLVKWESWRFWEALAAGCVPFHLDYEKYDADLPVMPNNWQHYVGIDLDNIQESIDRIADDPELLERISTEGRLWALQYYSPVPTAERFMEIIRTQIAKT